MAWRVVILGGGFGGLYTARKLEKLLPQESARVGRDTSELGQLGHPPQLAAPGLSEHSAGGSRPDGGGLPEDARVS